MYSNLKQALLDLERAGMLKRITEEVDPYLEMAEIARQAFDNNGPAILFEKVKGSKFQAVANIFGTRERMDFLFRKTLKATQTAVEFKSNPVEFFKHPSPAKLLQAAKVGLKALPQKSGSIKDFEECKLSDLPQVVGWPEDGGAFLTLPQVATRPSENGNILQTNLGMYRVQISGNEYASDECGLHYQIKRDIASHHQKAIEEGRPLKVSIFIGGSPAHTLAAVMPMPENLSELTFAGMLAGKRFRYFIHDGYLVSSDAEFCILGEMAPDLKPEGPFGDHVGYYSGKHDFPYIKVKKVLCKKNAIYPFTVVGRPPKEDTLFGEFIHSITKPMVPSSLPGVHAVHAVDEAGVHPLCLALASERFRPYAKPEEREPMELLKTANSLLGFNQVSLAKYLLIAAKEDNPALDVNDVEAFFGHVLERMDFGRDLHFQTATTVDTLDYTGTSLNHGSKLVLAAAGEKRRNLRKDYADLDSLELPTRFSNAKIAMAGAIAIQWDGEAGALTQQDIDAFKAKLVQWKFRENYPWVSIVNDSNDSFLWQTFTRSDPAQDIYGINERFTNKHWAIEAPMIVDATIKERHQKVLSVDSCVKQSAKRILAKLCLVCAFALAPFANAYNLPHYCGTIKAHEIVSKAAIQKFAATLKEINNCAPEEYYDSVYTRSTDHFQIFYTLEGPHATTQKFVDSTAVNLERAWKQYVSKDQMRSPLGNDSTYQFHMPIEKGHYPVEIVDLHNIAHAQNVLGDDMCSSGCFGITHPTGKLDSGSSQLFIDNDFLYVPSRNVATETYKANGKSCHYAKSTSPLMSFPSNSDPVDYSKEWAKGVRVTTAHELYHAVQLRYLDYRTHYDFWFEASASGHEEILDPSANDYTTYLNTFFATIGDSLGKSSGAYGAGTFYLYLHNHVDSLIDKEIWEGFAKSPYSNFWEQLSSVLSKKKLAADSIFHDFAIRLSFSGKRSKAVNESFLITSDESIWPEAVYQNSATAAPQLKPYAIQFYNSNPELSDFAGKASVALYKDDKATIKHIANTKDMDDVVSLSFTYDSLAWILSRYGESSYIPELVKDSTLRAYPTPWRGGNLCFTPLPESKKFIEIRTRRGDLVMRVDYAHTTHCIDESTVKAKMRPGAYKFRAGAKGKLSDLLIIY